MGRFSPKNYEMAEREACRQRQGFGQESVIFIIASLIKNIPLTTLARRPCAAPFGHRRRCPPAPFATLFNLLNKKCHCGKSSLSRKNIISKCFAFYSLFCGEGGIRTLDTLRYTRFPSVRTRPLCDLSLFTSINSVEN